MKTWKIPVRWEEEGIVEIVSNTLAEAIKIAQDEDGVIPVPDGSIFIDDTWKVACQDIETLRQTYNKGRPDDIPITEHKLVIHAEWIHRPGDRVCSHCNYRYSYSGGTDYNFCPECGAEMKGEKK